MELPRFESTTLTFACTSDTHNADPSDQVPLADVFLHAGDMTDDGTFEELETAFRWISALQHKLKIIVAGNHDLGLDRSHPNFSQKSYDLFTGDEAKKHRIVYLDRETKTVAECYDHEGNVHPLKVYANPCQPDFLKSNYAFTYLPYPDKSSEIPWEDAPKSGDGVDVWLCHSPPKGILDAIPVQGLTGCEVMLRKAKDAKPAMCVFGHYHSSYGKKLIKMPASDEMDDLLIENDDVLDLASEQGSVPGAQTLFLNAAYMTMQKTKVEKRNKPWLVKMKIGTSRHQADLRQN